MKSDTPPSRFDRIWFFLAAVFISIFAWAINLTVRYRYQDWDRFESTERGEKKTTTRSRNHDPGASRQGGPVILSFWHNQIFLGTYVFRFRRIAVMTSRHRDGEYIAGVIRLFGYLPVRGSSSQRPVAALLEMKKCLAEGRTVAFTIDGPRGPRYKVKGGPVVLAAKTGLPLLCFHIEPQRYWRMKSWDGFRIPKPFTRALIKIGKPLEIPADADREAWIEKYQAEMDRIQQHCREVVESW